MRSCEHTHSEGDHVRSCEHTQWGQHMREEREIGKEGECVRIRKRKEDREKGKVCVFLLVLWHGQAALQGFHVRIEIPK